MPKIARFGNLELIREQASLLVAELDMISHIPNYNMR